jgi:cyclic beta-1,2-glucan synthetase
MKVKSNAIDELLSPLRQYFQKDGLNREDVNDKPPLRLELFSTDQMEQHAILLATSHVVDHGQAPEQLLKRLADNEEILIRVTSLLQETVREKKAITPAGEWLLDNFYLIEEQIRTGKRYLPKGYSKGLPKLRSGIFAGYPRVYDIAIEIISHSDGHVDIQSLSGFIAAYQKVSHLTIGELWAIPIMLRLALLENLRRVAARIAIDRIDASLATHWATLIIEVVETDPKDLVLVMADMARSKPPMVSAFVAEFARRLQWKGLDLTLPLTWIEQHLSGTGHNINAMVLAENQQQAADQLSVSNSINSLRFLAKTDWREFVETISVVEHVLRQDEVYPTMDFFTRDNYRREVEKIGKKCDLSEHEIARIALELSRKSQAENPSDEKRAHVGYWLIDKGVTETERLSRIRESIPQQLRRAARNAKPSLYSISSLLLTLAFSFGLWLGVDQLLPTWILVITAIIVLLSTSHLAISIVNWISTLLVSPKPLPRLNFIAGIPTESRTMVVVPTILADAKQIDKLLNDLEVRFLGNSDPNLLFGLLTDFRDAQTETTPADSALVMQAMAGVETLNNKYHNNHGGPFYLLHRPRRYNAADKVWMGFERKRGKLTELNHLMRGKGRDNFSGIVGDSRQLESVKYVITLDTDTQLPREAAWKLVGLMAHPLNRPVLDPVRRRVVEGYGIIQPRIAISLHRAQRSTYTKLNESDSGIDPYTRVTSDVYQDIFEEGSFIGKGIYDVDAFEEAIDSRFPNNRILSHDLLEGSYVRCAFASDVQLYEEYPSRYDIDMDRRHRWIRGDWQIAPWFLPFVPGRSGRMAKNPISALSRWKIFDNLRRSFVPPALTLLLIAGWTILGNPWFWTLGVLLICLLPSALVSVWNATHKPKEVALGQHINNTIGATHRNIIQSVFNVVCLPYEAYRSVDAILRTLWRLYISKRNLLEWSPSDFAGLKKGTLTTSFVNMLSSPFVALITFALINYYSPLSLIWAAPFIIAWVVAPFVAWAISRPHLVRKSKLNPEQLTYLRLLSRKTWSFFETLVTADDNWLPPDNLQQYPVPVIAHRTSPTNIGLALLSNMAAVDFGYSTVGQMIVRTANTFGSMDKLERYRGHFYNWYDTQTLRTLNPRYISSVDSGNMAGHLLTLRQGFFMLAARKIVDTQLFHGLRDTLGTVMTVITKDEKNRFKEFKKLFDERFPVSVSSLRQVTLLLEELQSNYHSIAQLSTFDNATEAGWWVHSFDKQIDEALEDIEYIAPWHNPGAIPDKFKEFKLLDGIPSLLDLLDFESKFESELDRYPTHDLYSEERKWIENFRAAVKQSSENAKDRISKLNDLGRRAFEYANMDYSFLFDKSQKLLAIGYSVDDRHRDQSFYDLLASEARLAAFVAIAQGKIPEESWFALGRRLTTTGNTSALLSWSGSMFEYLMPLLVMPTYENTLLDETYIGTVEKQIEYGRQQNLAWGVSESCYNLVDNSLTYQYKAFGVPGLGFKRGLGQDLVIAPYATVMALMVNPLESYRNLQRMKDEGLEGRYGFYESIDYTPVRLSRDQSRAVIQTFMAHHQGMGFLSLAYLLLNQPMQRRFEADVHFQTSLLLLQEQVPKTTGFYTGSADTEDITPVAGTSDIRVITSPDTIVPEVQLLSNGRYHVMVTNAGGGYSRWKDLAVTRWREDGTTDPWGSFCFIRDVEMGEYWSTGHQPALKEASLYEAIFSQGRVEFRRRDNEIETYTEIIVSPEDDIEVRRVQLTNRSKKKRTIEITSYSEVVLASSASDASHPAFSNLFVQTEVVKGQHAIRCTRRARSHEEHPPWMFHLMKLNNADASAVVYETDRSKFIGRGRSIHKPIVMNGQPLSGSEGSVLDPIIAIQYTITIAPGDSVTADIITGISATKDGCQGLIDKYQDRHMRDRAFELSWTHSQVVLRQIGATEADAQLFGRLASSVIYHNPALRASPGIISKNKRGQSGLWSHSISGDLPIVLLQVSDTSNLGLVRQVVKAQAYWHLKGLAVDLVVLNEDPSGYRQVLQEHIQGLIAAGIGINTSDKQGRIFVRTAEQVSAEDRILFQTVARVIIADSRGSLADQMNKRTIAKSPIAELAATKDYAFSRDKIVVPNDLQFFNGTGGFTPNGKEYVIISRPDKPTPLPWINVIANKNFGTIVSDSGSSYTWMENAHEFRLTPWANDPVADAGGEAFYIRDEETGLFWSPMPYPVHGVSGYVVRHGFGYTIFEHSEDGIFTEAKVFVDKDAPIKFISIRVVNRSGRARKLTATGYVEWVLGALRPTSMMHVVTELDNASGAIIARNSYNSEFGNRVGFLDTDDIQYHYTADRTEFVGRNNTLENPEAMHRTRLSGRSGAGLDPCAALQVPFDLDSGREREIVFRIGAGKDTREALDLIQQFQGSKAAETSLRNVREFWEKTLSSVQIDTPDPTLNILTNGWLIYQVMACRLWGRSGFYQSGGAFGFRDQLQDVLALLHVDPKLTRAQILISASRQFREGDVQHWWHPPLGRGVRTMCSDDFMWLPYATSRYIAATGDIAILDEQVPFIQGRPLNANEESYYDLPVPSDQSGSLYEHCKRAMQHAFRFGENGLPLIGSGDWNDGMNMVGINGKGESVWLAFFLYDVLLRFMEVSKLKNDGSAIRQYQEQADLLKKNINANAWDGNWYLRAFFDDGTPLGSSANEECRIDSISQSWAVLSGAGLPERTNTAMKAVDRYLVNRSKKLIQLLDPPFDKSHTDPGYIKGYVPGVRENGGQYTHAAIWMVMAFAKMGDRERTLELINLINPIAHGTTEEQTSLYKAEPYVMAADVYGVEPHTGRGGWTWYTGSAGWMYQLILESFLGLRREGDKIWFEPCVPHEWPSFSVRYRYLDTWYDIKVYQNTQQSSVAISVDGVEISEDKITLVNDLATHNIVIHSHSEVLEK